MSLIQANHLTKTYRSTAVETTALKDISFSIDTGEFIAIMGPSGSGKSTLMHILGALDIPSDGEYFLDGSLVSALSDDRLAEIRNQKIGFIFQAFNLLPRTSALRNVIIPMIYAGVPKTQRITKATQLLRQVGLGNRLHHASNQLSGGQQQRVAIARALSLNPSIILADEPTGNIASTQAHEIMSLFQQLNNQGHTIIIITHESDIAQYAKRIIYLKDGRITKDHTKSSRRRSKKK